MTDMPRGAVEPREVITDLFDNRLFEITLAGGLNNRQGAVRFLIEQGLADKGQLSDELEDLSFEDTNELTQLLESAEVRSVYEKWYIDLYMNGVKRLFGYRAANRQTKLQSTYSEREEKYSAPVPVYVGKLPPPLDNEETREALQRRLDVRYGEHGVLMGPPPVVMALYEDIAVSLRPAARTLIQGKSEVWQLESYTHLQEPIRAHMAA